MLPDGACPRERGQATVEFALVMPLIVFGLLAILQVGLVVRDQVAVIHAAREAARAASVDPDPGRATGAARRVLPRADVHVGSRPAGRSADHRRGHLPRPHRRPARRRALPGPRPARAGGHAGRTMNDRETRRSHDPRGRDAGVRRRARARRRPARPRRERPRPGRHRGRRRRARGRRRAGPERQRSRGGRRGRGDRVEQRCAARALRVLDERTRPSRSPSARRPVVPGPRSGSRASPIPRTAGSRSRPPSGKCRSTYLRSLGTPRTLGSGHRAECGRERTGEGSRAAGTGDRRRRGLDGGPRRRAADRRGCSDHCATERRAGTRAADHRPGGPEGERCHQPPGRDQRAGDTRRPERPHHVHLAGRARPGGAVARDVVAPDHGAGREVFRGGCSIRSRTASPTRSRWSPTSRAYLTPLRDHRRRRRTR